jgi:RecB family exonuclease
LALMETLTAEADAGGTIRPSEYRALLQTLMAAREVPEEAVVTDPGVAIWGTLEARVQSADLVILGGMNETVWPRLPSADPWLSRTLRAQVGLPSPERRIGLSAHDFQQAMGAGRVILTRALRDAEAPTVASRWLMRLENLLRGLGPEGQAALEASKDRGDAWLAMAPLVDLSDTPATPARRPEPRPPVEARPDGLSVTQIETLVRDPYAIYARKVLGLRPLEPVGRKSDAMARGSAIHSALETFVRENMDALPEDAETAYFAALRSALHKAAPSSAVRAWWTARLGRASEWFLEGERERRLRGRPVALEVKGERPLTGLHRTFMVTAKADRIDAANDGRYGFYDYKSGNVPSEKEVKAFHLQLPLEAAIAEAGGFDGLPAAGAFRLELIGLGAQATRRVDADPHAVAVTWARLHKLIRYYLDPANGFTARLRPQKISFESEYDHLSRKGEWSDGEPPEGDT